MEFSGFALRREIVSALDKMGYKEATSVQSKVIPLALEGKNLVVQSATGSGKTGAFVIPALNELEPKMRKAQVLILEPTRELAMQTREEVYRVSSEMRMGSIAVFGGFPIRKQIEELKKGPQVVIATPGRLMDLMERGVIDLSNVKTLIIDEVDQMMDMGFSQAVTDIWKQLDNLSQTMTFSATYTKQIMNMLDTNIDGEYESLILSQTPTVDTINHVFMRVGARDKYVMLKNILEKYPDDKVMIFTARKHETEELERYLYRDGFDAAYIHGDMYQRDRVRALRAFKEGKTRIFIGTDVASRGLNLNNIDLVINYHVPNDPEAYIHRIGRTGRAGADGKAIMFVSSEEDRHLFKIEKMHKIEITEINLAGEVIPRPPKPERKEGGRRGGRRPYRGAGGYRGGRGSDRREGGENRGYRGPRRDRDNNGPRERREYRGSDGRNRNRNRD